MLDHPLWFPEDVTGPWTHAVGAALAEMYQSDWGNREVESDIVWPLTEEAAPRQLVTPPGVSQARPATAKSRSGEEARPSIAERPRARTQRSEAATKAAKARAGTMSRNRPQGPQRRSQADLARVLPRQGAMQMSHAVATRWLKTSGLRTTSSGHCTSRHLHHCTSLDAVRVGTIARVIDLKRLSGCPVMVTGGTEAGHAPGQYSHGNGYKLDITHNKCIDRYITRHHHRTGVRGDGAALYRSGEGTVFADESSHWDILFK
ncbi:MAG: hypothetical protein HOQ38_12505 [Nonomuraea sp.]|nr:hypothetical protein [Nonomuraea sp.]